MTLEEAKRVRKYNQFILKNSEFYVATLTVPVESNKNCIPKDNFGQWLLENGFFSAPASTKYHGCYAGGLFDHSIMVAARLIWLTNNLGLKWDYPDSPLVVGLFHDLCKIDKYEATGNPAEPYKYKTKLIYEGHGMRSLALLQGHLSLSEEEAACIVYHMGAYEKDMWDGYDAAIHKFPNVLYTHTADMHASKIDGV